MDPKFLSEVAEGHSPALPLRVELSVAKNPEKFQKRPYVRFCGPPRVCSSNSPATGGMFVPGNSPDIFDFTLIFKLIYRKIDANICGEYRNESFARRIAVKSPILYFAYGSNMNPFRMAQRCPRTTPLGVGILRNYRGAERL